MSNVWLHFGHNLDYDHPIQPLLHKAFYGPTNNWIWLQGGLWTLCLALITQGCSIVMFLYLNFFVENLIKICVFDV
jgi:hypothetical protein